jgi:hypothetical protein
MHVSLSTALLYLIVTGMVRPSEGTVMPLNLLTVTVAMMCQHFLERETWWSSSCSFDVDFYFIFVSGEEVSGTCY